MSEPIDAAALILLSHDRRKVLWARRNPELRFLGGFHGFTGGKLDPADSLCEVRNERDSRMRALIACAVREAFEETGVLLVRNGEKLTKGQRASLHDDLVSGRESFSAVLDLWDLWIDGRDFQHTGHWTTPEFSPVRFKTHFFIASCPGKQVPYQAIDEMLDIEFVEPLAALERWSSSSVLIAPPVLISIRELARHSNPKIDISSAAVRLRTMSSARDGDIDHLELNSRLIMLPLRTKTLPPATHTNCFISGRKEFIVIDPAARDASEREKLYRVVDELTANGGICRAIVVSHLHRDHLGGELPLRKHIKNEHGVDVPIAGHRMTADALKDSITLDELLEDGASYELKDGEGKGFRLDVLHTPGHARGHLCFYDRGFGFLLSMDNVLGTGSVLIDPPEGNMTDYLESLRRMRDLPGLRFLCGSHGQAVSDARRKIEEYIHHRLDREAEVLEAMEAGAETPDEVAGIVYRELDPELLPLAVRSAAAHIERILERGKP